MIKDKRESIRDGESIKKLPAILCKSKPDFQFSENFFICNSLSEFTNNFKWISLLDALDINFPAKKSTYSLKFLLFEFFIKLSEDCFCLVLSIANSAVVN